MVSNDFNQIFCRFTFFLYFQVSLRTSGILCLILMCIIPKLLVENSFLYILARLLPKLE